MVLSFAKKETNDMRQDFLRSFKSFMEKCPIIFEKVDFIDDTVYIFFNDEENPLVFHVDLFDNKQNQIFKIKEALLPYYPRIWVKEYRKLTNKEIAEREEKGDSMDTLLNERKPVLVERFTIIKAHDAVNEVDVRDNLEKSVLKYKLKIPVITFLEVLSSLEEEETESYFGNNRKFVSVISSRP